MWSVCSSDPPTTGAAARLELTPVERTCCEGSVDRPPMDAYALGGQQPTKSFRRAVGDERH